MYAVYVIVSCEGYRYIGQTENLEKRLAEHNTGMSSWTKRGSLWKVVYREEYETRKEAMTREKYLKSGHGRTYLEEYMRTL